jgi:hypothetical protein
MLSATPTDMGIACAKRCVLREPKTDLARNPILLDAPLAPPAKKSGPCREDTIRLWVRL